VTHHKPPAADADAILLRRDGAVAHLRFNRPKALNAIDGGTARRFLDLALEVSADPAVRAIVLSGEGKAFMAGGDLAAMRADPSAIARDIIGPLHTGLRHLADGNAPVIASVQGVVAGAGVSLMANADFAIAAEGTRFNLAYINIGTSADGGASFALPRLVGLRKTTEIALLGDAFDAAEAERIGLVNRVVPAADLEGETAKLAARLAAGPTLAYGRMRRLLRRSLSSDCASQLEAEGEGIAAFFEKRPARFRGA
jgi:2-(1,2-epoxy-1,2-dihydrophenyl)acetyl-CoA isomerase